jgi:hypothetical protein
LDGGSAPLFMHSSKVWINACSDSCAFLRIEKRQQELF